MIIEQESYKPFIKWAGGKTQLLSQITRYYPKELKIGTIKNYYEPFLGGGACFFNLIKEYKFDNIVLSDINQELIITYQVVKKDVDTLILFLNQYKSVYSKLSNIKKEEYYYEMRNAFNINRFSINYLKYSDIWIPRAAQFIFLNKTCFNGLYRINQKGDFNVPFGKRYNPEIFELNNIVNVSKQLQNAEIRSSDFSQILKDISADSFVFIDPPYRPLMNTANFTSYTKINFNDQDHFRLSVLCNELNKRGVKLMITNSDPENRTKHDNFFKDNFSEFKIRKLRTTRMINNSSINRNKVTDLLITNY